MDQEQFKQIIELVSEAGDGAHQLIILYFVKDILGWIIAIVGSLLGLWMLGRMLYKLIVEPEQAQKFTTQLRQAAPKIRKSYTSYLGGGERYASDDIMTQEELLAWVRDRRAETPVIHPDQPEEKEGSKARKKSL